MSERDLSYPLKLITDEDCMEFEENFILFRNIFIKHLEAPLTEEEQKGLEELEARDHLSEFEVEEKPRKKLSERQKKILSTNYFVHLRRFPTCKSLDELMDLVDQEQENLKKQSEENKHSGEGYKSLRYGCPKTWNKLEKNVELKQKQISQNVKANAKYGDHFCYDMRMAFVRKKPLVDKMYHFSRQFRRFLLR